jgi:Tfp pilus assembly PilM family ATPase/Tfp pilus assembly protein PilN
LATRNAPRKAASSGRAVAIDIGPAAIRAVEVQVGGDDARILKRGSAPLPPGVWEDLAGQRDALALALRAALSAAGIAATEVAAALPRRLVTLKYARLPHGDAEQIAGMVLFEAQQYIPFPLDEVVLDHQIVSDETDEMTTVMIVAARRPLVEDLLAAFDKAGLEVVRLSVSALALAEHGQGSAVPMALLDVEAGEMDLAVVSAGRLLFSRAASLGGAALNDGGGQRLAGEVARSLTAYQNEYHTLPVSKLLIAGAPNDLPILESSLGALLDVPIGRLNGKLLPSSDPDALAYATAAGLALESAGTGVSRINLIPASRTEKKVAAQKRVHGLMGLAAAVAALAVGGYFLQQSLEAGAKQHAEAVKQNDRLNLAKTVLQRTKGEHDTVAKTYNIVSFGMGRQKPMVDVVKAVSDAVPKNSGIHLTQLAFERGTNLALHGSARDESAATDLVLALQTSGAFRDVRLNYLGDSQAETIGMQTANSAAAKNKAPSSMSFLVTCRVIGAEPRPKVDTSRKPAPANQTTQPEKGAE